MSLPGPKTSDLGPGQNHYNTPTLNVKSSSTFAEARIETTDQVNLLARTKIEQERLHKKYTIITKSRTIVTNNEQIANSTPSRQSTIATNHHREQSEFNLKSKTKTPQQKVLRSNRRNRPSIESLEFSRIRLSSFHQR